MPSQLEFFLFFVLLIFALTSNAASEQLLLVSLQVKWEMGILAGQPVSAVAATQ